MDESDSQVQIVIDDDGEPSDAEDDVEIAEDAYIDIASVDTTLSFETWWPQAAEALIMAMFGTKEDRRSAIQIAMPLFEFSKQPVKHVSVESEAFTEVKMLYDQLLQGARLRLYRIKNEWCDKLTSCFIRCRQTIREYQNTAESLKQSALSLVRRNQPHTPLAMFIVKDELGKHLQKLFAELDLKLLLIKTESCRTSDVCSVASDRVMERKIHESRLPKEQHALLRSYHHMQLQNIQAELAEQIQEEFKQTWIGAFMF